MRSWVREHGVAVACAVAATCVVARLSLYGSVWGDYNVEARPAVDALLAGHLLRFVQLAPAYGGSLVLRSPFILAGKLWGGGDATIYRASVIPCLLAAGVLAVWLAARLRSLGRSTLIRLVALLVCVANPITVSAIKGGHPEDLLGAVLSIAAVLVAMRGRAVLAGVVLGLAVVNKEWALVAAGPVLLALPERRGRALLAAGATAAVVLSPFLLAGSAGGFASHVGQAGTQTGTVFQRWQVWWFFGPQGHPLAVAPDAIAYRAPPGWVERLAHPLIVGMVIPLTLICAWLRSGRKVAPDQPLLLLVLLLLLRFVLDPWDAPYYSLPFLLALLVWETLRYDRLPVLSLLSAFAWWVVFEKLPSPSLGMPVDTQTLIFLAIVLPAVLALGATLYAPGATGALAIRTRRRVTYRVSRNRRGRDAVPQA